MLIQVALAGSPPVATVPGGYADTLPPDQITAAAPMAWAYRDIYSEPEYVLGGQTGWTELHVQIDCFGYAAANALELRNAIYNVLRGGYRGTLPDPDATYVFQIVGLRKIPSAFLTADRTWVRKLECIVQYQQV